MEPPINLGQFSWLEWLGIGLALGYQAGHLKATVKATPVDADGHGSTIQQVGLAPRVQDTSRWTAADVPGPNSVELQNLEGFAELKIGTKGRNTDGFQTVWSR